ncbi:unnamed protein product [Caenorhabditis auriculariae]|uniref:receptor protein serine/threonine kinase n=1 Tax=Caenorhabditis auriculariae TaxID=2777116 RepID=A0A8S1HRK8_9PELO|nr:unnamed protein product [Caenorhabditis auriculariae]
MPFTGWHVALLVFALYINVKENSAYNDELPPAPENYPETEAHVACSVDNGCSGSSHGFMPIAFPGIFNGTDLELWRGMCLTDGFCYQSIANVRHSIRGYGCVDKYEIDMDHPLERGDPFCKNTTDSVKLCCAGRHFCANETILPQNLGPSGWLYIAVSAAAVIHREPLLRLFFVKVFGMPLATEDDHSDSTELNKIAGTATTGTKSASICSVPSSDFPPTFCNCHNNDVFSPQENQDPEKIRVMLDTTGSGFGSGSAGPTQLTEKTIALQIKLLRIVGAGRFGEVHIGIWKGEEVAVKIFKSSDEYSWAREVGIYQTNMLRHPNVLRFIGSDRHDEGLQTRLWLVTEYHNLGSLYDFLSKRPIDLRTAFIMLRSTINGLSFLHTGVAGMRVYPETVKPAIAHRDLKLKNIMGPPNEKGGTVRYLAPELLSNTVQNNIFDTYLMADIYAFSLVMYEILQRTCHNEVLPAEPEKMIAYYGVVGRDPTLDIMREVVHVKRLRPTFHKRWLKEPEFRAIYELCCACWEPNPTARLSALQIRTKIERVQFKKIHRDCGVSADKCDSKNGWCQHLQAEELDTMHNLHLKLLPPATTKAFDEDAKNIEPTDEEVEVVVRDVQKRQHLTPLLAN